MDLWSDFPKTVIEFEERFASEESSTPTWSSNAGRMGFRCPACGHDNAWELARRRLMECRVCHRQVSVTAGTILHRSRKPLRLWFKAMLLMTSQRPGISALSLMRLLGLTSYQTAWTWLHKLRRAMVRPGREPLTGKVEVDDGYVGGEEGGARPGDEEQGGGGRGRRGEGPGGGEAEDGTGRGCVGRQPPRLCGGQRPAGQHGAYGRLVGLEGLRREGYRHRPRPVGDPKRAARLFPMST